MSQPGPKVTTARSKSVAAQNFSEVVVDEHQWTYFCCVINPTFQRTTSTQTSVVVGTDGKTKVRVTGAAADVNKLREFCDGHPVVSRLCRLGSSQSQSARELEDRMNLLKEICRGLMGKKVCVRLANDPSYCEIIGSSRDVDDVRSEFENAMRTGSTSATMQPIVGAMTSAVRATSSLPVDRGGYDYQSKKLRLTVSVICRDILSETCDVIVCPSGHQGTAVIGVGQKILKAAGPKVVDECKKYMGKNRKFNETDVFHTSSGNLCHQPGIRNIIHARGPNLDITNSRKSLDSLKRTFLNCFKCAETELRAKFMVLPAIGGGNGGFSAEQVSEAACGAIEEFENFIGSKTTFLRAIAFVDINNYVCEPMAYTFCQHFHFLPVNIGQQVSNSPSSLLTTTNTATRTTTAMSVTTPTTTTTATRNLSVASHSHVTTVCVPSSSHPASNAEIPTGTLVDIDSSPSSAGVFNATTSRPGTSSAATASVAAAKSKDTCPICLDQILNEMKLDCGHVFCKKCIDKCFEELQPRCPCCGKIFGQLRGEPFDRQQMHVTTQKTSLVGYHGYETIAITYVIPDGFKNGKRYSGVKRLAYLPNNEEGNLILKLLKEAFDRGLIFTIGRSTTTGRENVITWNDIHHKTALTGPHGYPDATYLKRVREELAAKGIGVEPPPPAATGNQMTTSNTERTSL